MSRSLKVVHVGCGSISKSWFNAAVSRPDVVIAGIVDLNLETARARQAEFKLDQAQTGTDLKAMLKAVKPDVVFDCTVPGAHKGVTLAALKAGCHVLGEKPLADSLASARAMCRAAQKSGRIYAVMQNRRFTPQIRAFRKLIADGELGDLTTLYSDFFIGAHFGGFRDRMEHVLLLDMAIHTFDAARFLTGAEPVAVYCKEWNPKGSWYDHDASAITIFEMSNGIIYSYRGSWCAEGLRTTWESGWRAIGTKGSATWDGAKGIQAQAVTGSEGFAYPLKDVAAPPFEAMASEGHAGFIHDGLDCLQQGRIPQTVCTDNIKSLAMVFAAIKSAKTGKRVLIKTGLEK